MSHTNPPFLYQYVGDQVRIITMLGDDPLVTKSNKRTDRTLENEISNDESHTDQLDQKETPTHENIEKSTEITSFEHALKTTRNSFEDTIALAKEFETVPNKNISNEMYNVLEPVESVTDNDENNNLHKTGIIASSPETEKTVEKDIGKVSDKNIDEEVTANVKEPAHETVDGPSVNENELAENGDDEASFGTPDNSPKSRRKLAKGKYGKGKAPPPPIADNISISNEYINKTYQNVCDSTSQESLVDIVNRMPNTAIKESGTFHKDSKTLQVVNPIAENKKRHKSKSPGRIPKGNTTTIGRLLQLPGRLAFWNKTDDTNKSKSDLSEMSDHSRRSSNIDQSVIDEFQSCADLSKIVPLDNSEGADQFNSKDAFGSEDITQDIIDKSDALQKLIEAKIESHPEYKIVALHAEIPTTSKSTDV